MENNFKKIVNCPDYEINSDGVCRHVETKDIVEPIMGSNGYWNFHLKKPNGRRYLLGRHRAMGICHLPRPENWERMVVNHIDGIKGRDVLSNLEWVTFRENQEHAGLLGLTSKCRPCIITYPDGTKENFPSVLKVAERFGLTKDAVSWRLQEKQGRLLTDGTVAEYMFPKPPPRTKSERRTKCKVVEVMDVVTLEIEEYPSLTSFAKSIGKDASTVLAWIRGKKVGLERFKVRYTDGPDWDEFCHPVKPRVVRVTDLQENRIHIFDSVSPAAKYFGLTTGSMEYRLSTNEKTIFEDRFKYKFIE